MGAELQNSGDIGACCFVFFPTNLLRLNAVCPALTSLGTILEREKKECKKERFFFLRP